MNISDMQNNDSRTRCLGFFCLVAFLIDSRFVPTSFFLSIIEREFRIMNRFFNLS